MNTQIYNATGAKIFEAMVTDKCERSQELMGTNHVLISFELAERIPFKVDSFINFDGEKFALMADNYPIRLGANHYRYELKFCHISMHLEKKIFFRYFDTDQEPDFPISATLDTMAGIILDSLKRDYPAVSWKLGEVLKDTPLLDLMYSGVSYAEALRYTATQFETEWWIDGDTLNLSKCEKGNYQTFSRIMTLNVAERLVYDGSIDLKQLGGGQFWGDTDNVDYYGAINYLLNIGSTYQTTQREAKGDEVISGGLLDFTYGSEKSIPPSRIYAYGSERNITRKTNAQGVQYAKRLQLPAGIKYVEVEGATGGASIIKFYDDIYPKIEGTITEVRQGGDETTPIFFVRDANRGFDLAAQTIEGMRPTIRFTSGRLNGREFDVQDVAAGNAAEMEIFYTEQEGYLLPRVGFAPSVGDKYIIFNIMLPQAKIDEASAQLLARVRTDAEKFVKATPPLDCEADEIYWEKYGKHVDVGSRIQIEDADFGGGFVQSRVTKVSYKLESPYKVNFTLAESVSAGRLLEIEDKLNDQAGTVDSIGQTSQGVSRRGYNNAVEMADKFESLRAEILLVGTAEGQFMLTSRFMANVGGNPNIFTVSAGTLLHAVYIASAAKGTWPIEQGQYTLPTPAFYYLYVECPIAGGTGRVIYSLTKLKVDVKAGFYTFPLGSIGSVFEGYRTLETTTGYTLIHGSQINTGTLKNQAGQKVLDLDNRQFFGTMFFGPDSEGYDNIKDKPNLGNYATNTLVNNAINGLETKIDGKIEAYYQTTNPWNGWSAGTEYKHVGDLWYNTSTKILQRYIGPSANTWQTIQDADAIKAAQDAANALTAANNANNTVGTKRRVFLDNTPSGPYDPGDQWLVRTSGTMRVCISGRSSGYSASDWVLTGADGNVSASIDRGIFTGAGVITFGGTAGLIGSGTIRIWSGAGYTNVNSANFRVNNVGAVYSRNSVICEDANGAEAAGLSSEGVDWGTTSRPGSIRIWAGASYGNRGNAPFRVTMDGRVYTPYIDLGGGDNIRRGAVFFGNGGQAVFRSSDNKRQITIVSDSTILNSPVYIQDTTESGTSYTSVPAVISVRIGRSAYSNTPRVWMDCGHTDGWGSGFKVESRYLGDDRAMERTCINTGQMAWMNQLASAGIAPSPDVKNLVWDAKSGYVGWQ